MSTEAKHTPGRLEVRIEQYAVADTGDYDYDVTIFRNGKIIAHIVCDDALDYAPLFAAAPEMLEALEAIEMALAMGYTPAEVLQEGGAIRNAMKSVITKSKGENSHE